jgi:hypothetical protein
MLPAANSVSTAATIATAERLCVGVVACDSEAGRDAIAAAYGSTTLPPPATTLPPSPSTTPSSISEVQGRPVGDTTTTSPATTLPPDPVDLLPVYAVGESVMLGAAPQLQAGGVVVNAAVSRQGKNVADVIGQLRAGGQLGRVVVVQTGTNGPVSDDTFERIMGYLPPDETPLVVFLTVRARRGWIADNNARIHALPEKYPNVKVLDWQTESEKVRGELARDGYHLRTAFAKQFYANLVFIAIGRPDLQK